MRLRRPARERPSDQPETTPPEIGGELIGDLDGPLAVVSPDGTIAPLGTRWRLAWAVGAEDRWHIASREAAVRSHLVDDMPVVASAMRVPGGDVIQRVAAARAGAGRGALLEFVNETTAPVSLAVAVIQNDAWAGLMDGMRQRRLSDPASVEVRGSALMADGRVALDLGRAPGGAVAVADSGVWTAVEAGPGSGDCKARSRSGRAAAAAVVPLVPGAPVRALVPVHGVLGLGDAQAGAAAGWQAVVDRAATVSLPDETAGRAWRRGVAASILAAGSEGMPMHSAWMNPRAGHPDTPNGITSPAVRMARTAVVLDRVGLPDEADRARGRLLEAADASLLSGQEADAALQALASRRLRSGRTSGLAELAGPLAFEAGGMLQQHTLERVAAALDIEAPAAARDARRMIAETTPPIPALQSEASGADVATAIREAISFGGDGMAEVVRDSIAFGGDGLAGIEALLDCLVAEAADHLVIAPALPEEWTGAPIDVSSLATCHGRLSYSLRWHGRRPALLWEREPATRAPLRCGLDHAWSSNALAGEALLRP